MNLHAISFIFLICFLITGCSHVSVVEDDIAPRPDEPAPIDVFLLPDSHLIGSLYEEIPFKKRNSIIQSSVSQYNPDPLFLMSDWIALDDNVESSLYSVLAISELASRYWSDGYQDTINEIAFSESMHRKFKSGLKAMRVALYSQYPSVRHAAYEFWQGLPTSIDRSLYVDFKNFNLGSRVDDFKKYQHLYFNGLI